MAASGGDLLINWPVTFKTREAFEGFIEALEEVAGQPVQMQVPSSTRPGQPVDYQPAVLRTVDELFKHTERPVYQILFRMNIGYISINNHTSSCSLVGNVTPDSDGTNIPNAGSNAIILAKVLARYATAKWARPRFRKVKVVTRVPEAEARNRVWEVSVGGASVFLGGLAGAIGGILTNAGG